MILEYEYKETYFPATSPLPCTRLNGCLRQWYGRYQRSHEDGDELLYPWHETDLYHRSCGWAHRGHQGLQQVLLGRPRYE